MRATAVMLVTLGMAFSLNAQEIQRLRFDVGYGVAPTLTNTQEGFRGIHAIVAAETPWGEFGLHYTSRVTSAQPNYGGATNEVNASTIGFQVGVSSKSSRAQFTISAGLGVFSAKIKQQYYSWNYLTFTDEFFSNTSTVSRVAFPADMRMCWNFSDHFGLGAAVFGAYVKDNSYFGFHGFVRVGL